MQGLLGYMLSNALQGSNNGGSDGIRVHMRSGPGGSTFVLGGGNTLGRGRAHDEDGDVHVDMRVRKKVQSFRRASCEALDQAPGAQQALPAWSSNARARNGSRSSTTRS